MDLGIMLPFTDGLMTNAGFLRDPFGMLEEVGVESAWAIEHVVVAEDYAPKYPDSADRRFGGTDLGGKMVGMSTPT